MQIFELKQHSYTVIINIMKDKVPNKRFLFFILLIHLVLNIKNLFNFHCFFSV